jgi:sirohydrochlorin cobaltochelatase
MLEPSRSRLSPTVQNAALPRPVARGDQVVQNATMHSTYDAVILLAHGARDARWMQPFERMATEMRERCKPCTVALSFMEFAAPTFDAAVELVREAAARRVLVVPLFLSGGGHVAKDIPELLRPARERHPEMTFDVSGAVGEEPEVVLGMGQAIERLLRA